MSKSDIKTVKRRGFSFGSFFFGTFLGFLLCIGAIVGIGFLAYNKLNVNFVNSKLKTDINLGTEELNKKTIKEFVASANNMMKNMNTYTLNDLNKDFGVSISDEVMGLNISELKSVPINKISYKLQDMFKNISADELDGVMDLSNMDNILNKSNTYYYKAADGKLYKDQALTSTVGFEYSVENDIVTINDQTYEIKEGKVNIGLKYLPLTVAISDFTANMGDKITLGELEKDYGVNLPEYFDSVDREVTINELSEEIDKLHLADFLGYSYDDTTGKYYDDKDEDGKNDYGEELSGVIGALADTTISGVSEKIESLKLSDLFSDEELDKGALSLIDKDTKIDEIDTALETAFNSVTFEDLITAELVTRPANYDSVKEKYLYGTSVKIKDLTLTEIVTAFVDNIPTSDTPTT